MKRQQQNKPLKLPVSRPVCRTPIKPIQPHVKRNKYSRGRCAPIEFIDFDD